MITTNFKGTGDFDPFDNEPYEPDCRVCMQLGATIDEATKYVKEILVMLYDTRELDIAKLDDSLGQLCDCLGIELPMGVPMVKRKETQIFEFATELARSIK